MKRCEKISSLLISLMMILGFMVPATVFAAGDGSEGDPFIGSGDLGESYDGSISIYKFNISAWKQEINGDSRPATAEDGFDISYFGLTASGKELDDADQVGYYYLSQAAQTAGLESDRQPVYLSDMIKLSNITFLLEDAVPDAGKNGSVDPDDYSKTGTVKSYGETDNGVMKWTGVEQGYYIVTEMANDTVSKAVPPFVISMPMHIEGASLNDPDTDKEVKNIHIYPKNEIKGPSMEKDLQTAADVNGNIYPWQIRVTIPQGIADAKNMVITDKLSEGLDFVESSLKVYVDGASPEVILQKDTHYTVAVTLPDPGAIPPTTHTEVKITITQAGFTLLGGYEDQVLHFDYNSVINMTAEEFDKLDQVENEAVLDFTNEDESKTTTKPPIVPIEDYAGLSITKTDGATESRLAGAVFAIFTELDNGTNQPKTPLLDNAGNPVTITTGTDGMATYAGLRAGTYYLTELTAPTGYKPLAGYVTIQINEPDTTAQNTINANVKNYLDNTLTLPTTGGSGTFWFTIIGISLVLISGVIYLVYRKNKKSN